MQTSHAHSAKFQTDPELIYTRSNFNEKFNQLGCRVNTKDDVEEVGNAKALGDQKNYSR